MAFDLKKLFSDFEETVHANSGKDVDLMVFNTIHADDIEPVSIVNPNLERGPWIAGGACLRWYQGLPVGESDIDVFCANAKQASDVIEAVKSYGRFSTKFESENAVTLDYFGKDNGRWTIQVITRRYFASLDDVINSFDMTVCEIGTCGSEWQMGPFTARDIREKNLRFKQPLAPEAVKRMVKYWTYGYRPVDGLIEAVQENPVGRWTFTNDEDYNNAF